MTKPVSEVHLEFEVGRSFRRKSENDSPERHRPTFVAELVAGGGLATFGRRIRAEASKGSAVTDYDT